MEQEMTTAFIAEETRTPASASRAAGAARKAALVDIAMGASSVRVWWLLAMDDLATRYRRTKLGPFWITLSHAALIGGITLSFSIIFNRPMDEYFLYVAAGMTVWALIAASLTEAPYVFVRAEQYLLSFEMPASIQIFRQVLHQLIVFAHNSVIYLVALVVYKNPVNWNTLYVIPGLTLIAAAAIGYTAVLGFIGARFRDVQPAVAAVVTMLFMFTPVFWEKPFLRGHEWIAEFNPAYHMLEVVRAPLLGHAPTALNWAAASAIAAGSLALAVLSFVYARRRLSYWL
jgi:lipopolysaccharide transport system permease protein